MWNNSCCRRFCRRHGECLLVPKVLILPNTSTDGCVAFSIHTFIPSLAWLPPWCCTVQQEHLSWPRSLKCSCSQLWPCTAPTGMWFPGPGQVQAELPAELPSSPGRAGWSSVTPRLSLGLALGDTRAVPGLGPLLMLGHYPQDENTLLRGTVQWLTKAFSLGNASICSTNSHCNAICILSFLLLQNPHLIVCIL